jgi:hypothetical protein
LLPGNNLLTVRYQTPGMFSIAGAKQLLKTAVSVSNATVFNLAIQKLKLVVKGKEKL